MITADRVLSILRMKGPCIPVQIKKALGEGDTFMVGAMLTELRENGKIKVSVMKRGGSPYYYVPEHASRLAEHLDDLGEKDRRTATLLKQQRVLRDSTQDPLVRVSLRSLKDFAVPVEVKLREGTELFWKWFTTPNADAESLIRELLGMAKKPADIQPVASVAPSVPAAKSLPVEAVAQTASAEVKPERSERPAPAEQADEDQEKLAVPAARVDDGGDVFLRKILTYFADKHIQVISKNVLRKSSDIEFEISLPTAVGRVDYFCKAKSKKKSNDGDLSGAYVQGQLKKLPVLYVTTGEVTKKAKEKLSREFKGMVLVEL